MYLSDNLYKTVFLDLFVVVMHDYDDIGYFVCL